LSLSHAWTWVKHWLATSPIASMVKIGLGAALGAFVDELANQGVGPIWVAVGAALVPIVINWLNPADPRYGRGSATS
jgi:hypothetical protein